MLIDYTSYIIELISLACASHDDIGAKVHYGQYVFKMFILPRMFFLNKKVNRYHSVTSDE